MEKKIVFFDTQNIEKEYVEQQTFSDYKIFFYKEPLNDYFKSFDNITDAEIISVFINSRLTENVLKNFKNLKLIATRSVGTNHINSEYCNLNGIKIVNAPHYGDNTVAEYTMGLIINIARKINIAIQDLKHGKINEKEYRGVELYNKTLGIIGIGAIGQRLAELANCFNMKIIAFDIVQDPIISKKYNFEYVFLTDLIKKSDFISLNAPSTLENLHLIDKSMISLMKKDVFIINTARGELINTKDLYEALKNKKIKGVALDVLECEDVLSDPLKCLNRIECLDTKCLHNTLINHELLNLDNVIITPHIAYDTNEAIKRILEITVKNIQNFTKV